MPRLDRFFVWVWRLNGLLLRYLVTLAAIGVVGLFFGMATMALDS